MIIGLVGTMGAGKGVCAEYLGKKGFEYHSLSDEIRFELKARKLPETRESLTSVGNELRTRFGPAVLAQRVLNKIIPGQDYVIDSIRNPDEVKKLKSRPEFVLIKIDAPAQIRFDRIRSRARTGDVQTLAQFLVQEKAESESTNPNKQQLHATSAMAQYTLINDSTVEAFYKKIDSLLNKLK
ncbi:MAG: AAA family ATPase [bacterium]